MQSTTRNRNEYSTIRPPRLGLTLVELLVVMVILTVLIGAVLPAMAPNTEERRMREAVRGVSTAFTQARSRALATGRPAGVWIERMKNDSGAAMVLYQAQVPPLFAGFTTTSTVRVTLSPLQLDFFNGTVVEPISENLVHAGDTVKLNYQGQDFEVVSLIKSGMTVSGVQVSPTTSAKIPWSDGDQLPYQITRQPVRSSAPPYQLPEGTVIDLHASGVGDDFFHQPFDYPSGSINSNTDPILVMFSPSGRLNSVWHNEGILPGAVTPEPALGQIYLLIGKPEKVPTTSSGPMNPTYNNTDPPETLIENFNWKDLSNRWVVVSPNTGQVASSEIAFVDDNLDTLIAPAAPIVSKVHAGIKASRRLARDMRSLGGN